MQKNHSYAINFCKLMHKHNISKVSSRSRYSRTMTSVFNLPLFKSSYNCNTIAKSLQNCSYSNDSNDERNLTKNEPPQKKAEDIATVDTTEEENQDEQKENKMSGFAKAFDKFSTYMTEKELEDKKNIEPLPKPSQPFVKLLRHSKFMQMGDPHKKIVEGIIFHVVEDDLYIDFGGKFYCVCSRPKMNAQKYKYGSRVKLRIKELELSTRFLGSSTDMTLLEADATIIGLCQ